MKIIEKGVLVAIASLFLLATFIVNKKPGILDHNNGEPSLRRRLMQQFGHRSLQQQQQRPVIFTFFNPLLEDAFVTEMSENGDHALVEFWKEAWADAGFEPRVLTLADAKKHKWFIPINYMMEHTLLDGYNKMCIHRWLAMAAVGGGWMSDYDTFPLRNFGPQTDPLPNDGALTVHDRMVPDLVSGSADEYVRIAQGIIEDLLGEDQKVRLEVKANPPKNKKRRSYTRWSDQMSLAKWLETKPEFFKAETHVMIRAFEQDDEVLGQGWSAKKCQERTPESIWAVHFSHEAIKRALDKNRLHSGQTMDNRAEIAREWVATWKKSCGEM